MTAPAPRLVGPPLLNGARTAATRLDVSPQHVRNLTPGGKLRPIRVGRRLVIREHELERFIARTEDDQQ
jgi:excisionase family DNA binding protein